MCLFVIDGTWSRDFNSTNIGSDSLKRAVGNVPSVRIKKPSFIEEKMGRPTLVKVDPIRSNARKFFEESGYPIEQKFYYGGVRFGVTGADIESLYNQILKDIEKAIVSGGCSEISIVGWSRGAAIATELAQALMLKEFAQILKRKSFQTRRGMRHRSIISEEAPMIPTIKFLGLFDSVAMVAPLFDPKDGDWGEEVPKEVNYFVHLVAGDRSGPAPWVDFVERDPRIKAKTSHVLRYPNANHSDIGGISSTNKARAAYQDMRFHATNAGVK